MVLFTAGCSLPSLSFHAPVWIITLPATFTGRFTVVEHHAFAGKSFTCSSQTTGTVTVDKQGKATVTTQGGVFSISDTGQCVEQGKSQGWQAEGQVENPEQPYLKFTSCNQGKYRAEGSAEHIVAEYQATTQTGKLTGGVTCFDEHNQPVAELSFYLLGSEPRQ